MIEIFLQAPMEIQVLFLFYIVYITLEFIKN